MRGHGARLRATAASGLGGFADAFAAAGMEALVFDYRGFGASEGEPRAVVSVKDQVADYRAVIDAARSLPGVDPDRVVAWSVSFAGGHVLALAAEDRRLAAAVALTPATDGAAIVAASLRRDGPGPLLRLTGAAIRDCVARARGGERVMAPIAAPPGQPGALTAPGALEAYESVAGPDWRNEVAAEIFLTLGLHRPARLAPRVRCPILMQVADGDQAVPPASSIRAAKAARAVIRRYPGADHFDVYPGAHAHDAVLADQVASLQRTLGLAAPTARAHEVAQAVSP